MYHFNHLQTFFIAVIPVIFAITVHEVAHGWVALKFGDRTAQMMGRLTLNPIKHIDIIGTIIVPAVLFFLGGFLFGWAKPVPVTWQNLKNPKRDMAWVALAGPAANLLMIIFWGLIAKLGSTLAAKQALASAVMIGMSQVGIGINLALMLLNLLPIPPLDGSRVVTSLLPNRLGWQYNRLEPYGLIIIVVLYFTGILNKILFPMFIWLSQLLKTLFNL